MDITTEDIETNRRHGRLYEGGYSRANLVHKAETPRDTSFRMYTAKRLR